MKSYPLTESQLGMFLDWDSARESTQYTIAIVNRFPRKIDGDAFTAALEAAFAAEPIYRARFIQTDESVRWLVDDSITIKVVRREMSDADADVRARTFARGFDAFTGPLVRLELIETPSRHLLLTEIFHLITDGTSVRNLFKDVESRYAGAAAATAPSRPQVQTPFFGDYAATEPLAFKTAAYAEARQAAHERFANCEMSAPAPDAAAGTNAAAAEFFSVAAKLPRQEIDAYLAAHNLHPNLFFMGVFARTLALYANDSKAVFLTINHGRGKTDEWKRTQGCFVKPVPVVGEIKRGETALEYFRSFRLHQAGVYPFTHCCRELGLKGGWTFVFQDGTIDCSFTLNGVHSEYQLTTTDGAGVMPGVEVYGEADSFRFKACCTAGRYTEQTLVEFLARMKTVALNFARLSGGTPIEEVPLLDAAETQAVLALSTGETLEYDPDTTFIDCFRERAAERPDAVAAVDCETSITYGELDRRTDALAAHLRDRGVAAGDFVAAKLPRRINFLVAVIAIQKCGAGYIPIDPEYPQERIDYMVGDSGAKFIIDEPWMNDAARALHTSNFKPQTSNLLPCPSDPAYMIYTSGSTGRPKGVKVPHRALRNLVAWVPRTCGITPGFKLATHPSFSFDASVIDIFSTLAAGGELHILAEKIRMDISAMRDYIVEHGIRGIMMSTKIGMALIDAYPELPLDFIQVGGEKLLPVAKTNAKIINGYGPTEFCVCSSLHVVDQAREDEIPIGRAVPNTRSLIVDKLGALVPAGMPGELALAGAQLSDGYWRQREKTEKAFVELPALRAQTKAGESAYLTGDLARYNAAGELEYLGRLDFQVKLRGFRIEIGEIEAVAKTFPGIGAAAAEVRNVAGTDHLVLYFESATDESAALKAHLAARLTPYMVPDFLVRVESMPLTPNGKINRKVLPTPQTDDEPAEPPADEFEAKLLACVKSALKRDTFGVNHDFHRLGLTSLGAMELAVKIRKALDLKVSLRTLAEYPSVRALANHLNAKRQPAAVATTTDATDATFRGKTAAETPTPEKRFPMTDNQRGIYVDWLRNPGTTQYNIPGAIRFGAISGERLAAAAQTVFAAHPALRVRFAADDKGEVECVLGAPIEIKTEKLAAEPPREFFAGLVRPFAPQGEPLARACVYDFPAAAEAEGGRGAYLFFDIHHTVFDGVSMGIFLTELMRVLDGGAIAGEISSIADAAAAERLYLGSEDASADEKWFGEYLDGVESTRLESFARPDGRGCGRVTRRLDGAAISAFCAAHNITPSDFLLTAFTELLRRIGRAEDVLINFVASGRFDADFANTIGMFVKTLPVRGIKSAATFAEATAKMHLDVLDLLDRSRVSYANLCERFAVRPEILFVYEGGIFELPPDVALVEIPLDTAKAPLALTVNPNADGFALTFEFDAAVYAGAEIEHLAAMFATLAEGAAAAPEEQSLTALPLLTDAEAAAALQLAYGGTLEYDETKTFLNLFHAATLTRGFASAVVAADRTLTYRELDELSDALAAALAERHGVERGDFVAAKLPRTSDFIVAVLAIMKCGAAYIPIDPEYPQDRIDYILADSGAKLVIDEAWMKAAARALKLQTTNLKLQTFSRPSDPAYMIYTSGSTGRPKGVTVPHRALRNMIEWVMRDYGIVAGYRQATHPSFSFDASVIDIFPTLAAGGELHILPEEIRKDVSRIRDYIVERGIEGVTMSTQIGMALIDAYPEIPLKHIQLGGEKLMPTAKTAVKIINGYGPTEFCVCSSFEIVDQADSGDIPIGRPVANTWSLIVDRYGHLLPAGVAGEIALAGPQLADGYWRQREKTEKAFVELSALRALKQEGATAYRTGDLARYNQAGKLEYLGRLDFQVKLRGFRIEIGEIEAVAKTFAGVGAVAAEVRKVAGADHLVLYYESAAGEDSVALKAHLAAKLTAYMVPDYFVRMEKLPLTPNGKIDRRKLKSPTAAEVPREYAEPCSETERTIAGAFAEILKLERVGATDDFFELGGTSIIAIRAIVALQKAGLDVQYGDLFKWKSPRALAAWLDRTANGGPDASATADAAADGGFDYSAYDYSAIDTMLAKTRGELFEGFRRHSLGDVLLVGATGYLGVHVLKYLLENTDSTVYALLRAKKGMAPRRRADAQYVYYFGERLPRRLQDRIEFIEGDITDELGHAALEAKPATVINCAALVKHYVADDLMDRINVGGVENLIRYCERTGARLVHASTYSIGGTIHEDSLTGLDERHLFIGQESDNDYIRTKFLAERAILEAIAAGRIRGKIMRLGNLMGRESDGEFQMNVGANAFVNSLRSYKALGAYPLEELARPLEMSPIDRVAEAICLLATTPDDMYVFHPYNRYALDMGAVIAAMNAHGFNIDTVSRGDFAAHVDALKNDPARAQELQGILHYAGHLLKNRKIAPVDNTWTTTVLYRLGFRWRPAEDKYLGKFFEMLDGLGVFEN